MRGKAGVKLPVVNLYSDEVGRRELPTKLQSSGDAPPGCNGFLTSRAPDRRGSSSRNHCVFRASSSSIQAAAEKSIAVLPLRI